jgi:hypothetical protein
MERQIEQKEPHCSIGTKHAEQKQPGSMVQPEPCKAQNGCRK